MYGFLMCHVVVLFFEENLIYRGRDDFQIWVEHVHVVIRAPDHCVSSSIRFMFWLYFLITNNNALDARLSCL